jgi:hypothetical protein
VCFLELVDPSLLNVPLRTLAETALRALEHLAGLLVGLELPLEQRYRDIAELSAIGLVVSAGGVRFPVRGLARTRRSQ